MKSTSKVVFNYLLDVHLGLIFIFALSSFKAMITDKAVKGYLL